MTQAEDLSELALGDDELAHVRAAIRRWGKPAAVAERFNSGDVARHIRAWNAFVERDWAEFDLSEYHHDLGCRTWLELLIDAVSPRTATRITGAIRSADARFLARMQPRRAAGLARGIFWEANTLHPDEAVVDPPSATD